MLEKQNFGNQTADDFSIEIPWSIPSKKNSYEIHFAPRFLKAIRSVIDRFKQSAQANRLYWISPTAKVKQFEKNLSTWFALYLPDYGQTPISVSISVGQRNDVDNIGGAVLDALEKSRKIKNDRQVESISIHRVRGIKAPIVQIRTIKESALQAAA